MFEYVLLCLYRASSPRSASSMNARVSSRMQTGSDAILCSTTQVLYCNVSMCLRCVVVCFASQPQAPVAAAAKDQPAEITDELAALKISSANAKARKAECECEPKYKCRSLPGQRNVKHNNPSKTAEGVPGQFLCHISSQKFQYFFYEGNCKKLAKEAADRWAHVERFSTEEAALIKAARRHETKKGKEVEAAEDE